MQITRRLEFDAGHRISDHKSQCRHLHGHRYVLEVTLSGETIDRPGDTAHGMIMDFSDIKKIAEEHVVLPWDHAFLVWEKDQLVCDLLKTLPGHKTVELPVMPTVENLAKTAFDLLKAAYHDACGNQLKLERVRLYETPNCWADVTR